MEYSINKAMAGNGDFLGRGVISRMRVEFGCNDVGFCNAPGKNESSNRKWFSLLKSVYSSLLLLNVLSLFSIVRKRRSRCGFGACKRFPLVRAPGVIMQPEDKDAALLPHRINGQWALIHRPVGLTSARGWMSYSSDLRNWGNHNKILEARIGGWWDAKKIGFFLRLL
jgi:hypothetical protein